jgi:ATP-dependent helicase HrpA
MHRGEFGREAAKMLDEICAWLLTAAELKRRLRTHGNQWAESISDLQGQLQGLFAPGFVAAVPEAQWPRMTIYLKAISIRLDRLANKPARDAELTASICKVADRIPTPFDPARWLLEEWRVALFAQELKAQGAPNAEKVAALIKN